jgi:hypothetical protein
LWEKGPNAEDIKKIFPVYAGRCLSQKSGSQLGRERWQNFADDEEVETERRKWLRQRSKKFCAAGFDALLKRWEKCINVDGGYVEK